jgi:hypothetical protein
MSRKKVQKRLQRALEMQEPVRIFRRDLIDWSLRGFVVSVSDEWIAVQALEDTIYLDGLELIRRRDITSIKKDENAPYIHRALTSLGRPVLRVDLPQDAGTRDVIELVAAQASLIGVHSEQWDGEPLWIGRLERLGKKRFDLLFVDAGGEWDAIPDRWRYRDISRVTIGTRYIDGLERFGDTPPEPVASDAVAAVLETTSEQS